MKNKSVGVEGLYLTPTKKKASDLATPHATLKAGTSDNPKKIKQNKKRMKNLKALHIHDERLNTYSWDSGSLFDAPLHTIGTVAITIPCTSVPHCYLDYTKNVSHNMNSAISIALNTWNGGYISSSGDEVWYKFVANASSTSNRYTVYINGSIDSGHLYDNQGNLVARNEESIDSGISIVANLTHGETYYLRGRACGSNVGNYSVIISAPASNSNTTCLNTKRMYIRFEMPKLPRNPRIKKAELQLFQYTSSSEYDTYPFFGLYQVSDEISHGAYTPIDETNLIDYAKMRMGQYEDGEIICYTFDITTLIDKINKNESYSPHLVLKLLDESITLENNITLYGSSYGGNYAPKIVITYESSCEVNTSYTNVHNMLENGSFERGTSGWQCSAGVYTTSDACFNMGKALNMNGGVAVDRYAYQQVLVRTERDTCETFTLSGWAKGHGLPNHERKGVTNAPRFRLRAIIKYSDTICNECNEEEFTADFSPCTEGWQFASVQFPKSKHRSIQYIRVYCDYGYNFGSVYFDDIHLIRNSLESSRSPADFNKNSAQDHGCYKKM